jgi:peptidoglycan/xylan/chitin deacetylase (PgdA/CDA1 family)
MTHPLSAFMSVNLAVAFHEIPSRAWFAAALDTLARFYQFVSLDQVVDGISGRTPLATGCHVTFDDGHASFMEHALPLLRERRIPATLFVSPSVIAGRTNYWFQELGAIRQALDEASIRQAIGRICRTPVDRLLPFSIWSLFLSLPRMQIEEVLQELRTGHGLPALPPQNMSTTDLLEAADSGVRVGAHTCDHPVLANETRERSQREIGESVELLRQMLGRPVSAFAYPNGTEGLDFGERERQMLREVGVTAAFSTDVGFFGVRSNPLAIPRGGCPSLDGEPAWKRAARVALLPVWDRLSRRGALEAERRRAAAVVGVPGPA